MEKYKDLIFKIALFIVVVLLFLYLRQYFVGMKSTTPPDEIVAIVDGEKITKTQLTNRLIAMYGKEILERIIEERLVVKEAKRKKIKIPKEEIDAALNNLKRDFRTEEEFKEVLRDSMLTEKALREQLKIGLMLNHLVRETITEEEMKQHYNQHKEGYLINESVFCKHILVRTEQEAHKVYDELTKKGRSFEELARDVSIDNFTKNVGGTIGWISKGSLNNELERTAFELEINEISKPVRTLQGYHIIKVEQKRDAKQLTFEEAKERIRTTLTDMKTGSYINALKDKAKIKNLLFGEEEK